MWICEAYTNKHSVRMWRYERSHQKVLEEGRRSYWQNRDRDAMSVSAVSVRLDVGLLVLLLHCWTRAHPLKVSPSILNITVKLARLRCSFLPLARVLAFLPGFLLSCRGMDFGFVTRNLGIMLFRIVAMKVKEIVEYLAKCSFDKND